MKYDGCGNQCREAKEQQEEIKGPEVNKPIYNCLLISFFFPPLNSAVLLIVLFFFTESQSRESEMQCVLRTM